MAEVEYEYKYDERGIRRRYPRKGGGGSGSSSTDDGDTFDKEKYQGFTAGGKGPAEDPNAPKRSDFPEGLGGMGAYERARRDYKSRQQSEALKGR